MLTSLTRSRACPEHARDWLDRLTAARSSETVGLADAAGRVLQADLCADRDLPVTAITIADGFALQARASAGASDYNPLPLRLRAAGDGGPLQQDEAVAVASGAPLPDGADTVVTLDEADVHDASLELYRPVAVGQHVVRAGEEVAQGQRLFAAGHCLRPADLALLAQLGVTRVVVAPRPRVRLLVTAPPVQDTNSIMLTALLRRDGAGSIATSHVSDSATLQDALSETDADLILVCGGSGEGGNDFSAAALANVGKLALHGIAMSPGESAGLGRIDDTPVLLLPGTPIACFYTYEWFAGRAVRRLAGGSGDWPYGLRRATLGRKVASTLGRLEFCRVRLDGDIAQPSAIAEHRLLSSAVRADGFIPVPSASEGWPEGAEVSVWMQTRTGSQE